MRRLKALLVAVLSAVAVILAGCQSHTSVRADNIRTITDRLHCLRLDTVRERAAEEAADCQLDARNEVRVLTFDSNRQRDNWRRTAAATFDSGVYVTGSRWLVQTDNKTVANRVRKALGTGKVDKASTRSGVVNLPRRPARH